MIPNPYLQTKHIEIHIGIELVQVRQKRFCYFGESDIVRHKHILHTTNHRYVWTKIHNSIIAFSIYFNTPVDLLFIDLFYFPSPTLSFSLSLSFHFDYLLRTKKHTTNSIRHCYAMITSENKIFIYHTWITTFAFLKYFHFACLNELWLSMTFSNGFKVLISSRMCVCASARNAKPPSQVSRLGYGNLIWPMQIS